LKKIFSSLLLVLLVTGLSFAQLSLTYTIHGLQNGKVYLSSVYGSLHEPVDSCSSSDGIIIFNKIEKHPTGVYRISFQDSLYTDVILNHENVIMANDIKNLSGSIRIIESEENKIFYEYWQMEWPINDSIRIISKLGDAIYEANGHKLTPDLDSMALKAYQLSDKLDKYTYSLISKSQGLYVCKLLKAYVTPDWPAYKKTPGVQFYKSKHAFLKEHFFDNVDFSDSTLLNSEVFYVLCTDYLSKFVDTENDSNYIAAVDFVLNKAQPFKPVYDYILNLFIHTFEDTEWEATFIHLVDDYLSKNTCTADESSATLSERSAALKKLKPDLKAPDIQMNDEAGKPVSLYAIKAKVILLMFWSPDCEHCEGVMPQIQHIYATYHPLGLEVMAASIDLDKNAWISAINKYGMKWICVSDHLGFQSPVVKAYNAYSTPTFFLLDSEKNIITHPYSPKQMAEALQKVFGK